MATHTPERGRPIQLAGYTWRSGGLELLWRPWPAGHPASVSASTWGEPARWPLVRNMRLALSAGRPGAPGERRCIGYHPPEGGPPRPCPAWKALPPGGRAQCAECERCEGRLEILVSDGSRPPTGPQAAYLRSAHQIYLAAFGPGLFKVGVAGAGRTALRVLEQGAPVGLIVGQAADGLAARRLEHALGLAGTRERVPVRTKLRVLYPPPDADALLAELSDALERTVAALPAGWPADVERLAPPRAVDNTATLSLAALAAAPQPAPGPPAGAIRGCVVAMAGALLVMEPAQASLWGDGDGIAPAAHDLRAWLGWRVTPGDA